MEYGTVFPLSHALYPISLISASVTKHDSQELAFFKNEILTRNVARCAFFIVCVCVVLEKEKLVAYGVINPSRHVKRNYKRIGITITGSFAEWLRRKEKKKRAEKYHDGKRPAC